MAIIAPMKRASVTEAKNSLSALLDRVRHGETVVIEDRGIPVARLDSMLAAGASAAAEGRLARLERQGLVRRGKGPAPRKLLAADPPAPRQPVRASELLIEERRSGR